MKTFSSLKRIKTYLRSSIDDERLSNLAVLSIKRDLSSNIQTSDVLDNFASSTRQQLGKHRHLVSGRLDMIQVQDEVKAYTPVEQDMLLEELTKVVLR